MMGIGIVVAFITASVVFADSNSSSVSTDTHPHGAEETYRRIIPCLENNKLAHDHHLDKLKPPTDIKEHYLDLLEKTKIFRGVPYHTYHYSGPWIGKLHDVAVYSLTIDQKITLLITL